VASRIPAARLAAGRGVGANRVGTGPEYELEDWLVCVKGFGSGRAVPSADSICATCFMPVCRDLLLSGALISFLNPPSFLLSMVAVSAVRFLDESMCFEAAGQRCLFCFFSWI